jgi:hypothetical protein
MNPKPYKGCYRFHLIPPTILSDFGSTPVSCLAANRGGLPGELFKGKRNMTYELEARIRTRAYQIWENDPSPDGNAEKHWEEARRQIEAEGDGAQDDAEPNVDQSTEREQGNRLAPEELQELPGADAQTKTAAPAFPPEAGL